MNGLLIRLILDVSLLVFYSPSTYFCRTPPTRSNQNGLPRKRESSLAMNSKSRVADDESEASIPPTSCSFCGDRPTLLQQQVLSEIIEKLGIESDESPVLVAVNSVLIRFLSTYNECTSRIQSSNNKELLVNLTCSVSRVFHRIALLATLTGKKKQLEVRQQLQKAAGELLCNKQPIEGVSSFLLLTLLVSVLAVRDGGTDSSCKTCLKSKRAATSAIESMIAPHVKMDRGSRENFQTCTMARVAIRCLLQTAAEKAMKTEPGLPEKSKKDACPVDLHIITILARMFRITACNQTDEIGKACAETINMFLPDDGTFDEDDPIRKADISGAIALATQLRPWEFISPSQLVQTAVQYDLWHAAEGICDAVAATQHKSKNNPSLSTSNTDEISSTTSTMKEAVKSLLDSAIEARMYRNADKFATKFYDFGGNEQFLEARYLHACDTIAKVIDKGALPIIERQVERIDKSVDLVVADGIVTNEVGGAKRDDIRNFAMMQLEERTQIEAAQRLAQLWGLDYVYDEDALAAAVALRKSKYLQWGEAYPDKEPPSLASTPEALYHAFHEILGVPVNMNAIPESANYPTVYGFDAEWGDEDKGADLLQVASTEAAILVDIPALSKTEDGVVALEKTVGRLFSGEYCSSSAVLVGFHCRQDLSQLRRSPCTGRAEHWLRINVSAIVDLKDVLKERCEDQKIAKYGLSRCCEHFLGKLLDKSEQCSSWRTRPLSEQQRIYAALDAWACAAIYEKLSSPS